CRGEGGRLPRLEVDEERAAELPPLRSVDDDVSAVGKPAATNALEPRGRDRPRLARTHRGQDELWSRGLITRDEHPFRIRRESQRLVLRDRNGRASAHPTQERPPRRLAEVG